MAFDLVWESGARLTFDELMREAQAALNQRQGKGKSSKAEGLFKQVYKCIELLAANPRHPGLHTHEYYSLAHPYDRSQKVFEAYAQESHARGLSRILVLRAGRTSDNNHRYHATPVSRRDALA